MLTERTAICDGCGRAFAVIARHPMVEQESWCPDCLAILRACVSIEMWDRNADVPAVRAVDV
jgi:predicted amidophosphoribosyltransferase